MNAINNIRAAWNEVTPNCINGGVWKKLWPEARNNFVGVEEKSVIQNIVELASETGLEDVTDDDVEEWLQSHGESLINDELRELAERRIQSESEAFDAEEGTPVRDLTTEFLSNSIAITQIVDQFIENDPNWERSNNAKRGVRDDILLRENCFVGENLRKDNQFSAPTLRRSRDSRKTHSLVPRLRCN
jgi:hypothetical protein